MLTVGVDRAVASRRSLYPELTAIVRLIFISWCPMRRIIIVSIVLLPLMGCGSKRNQGGIVSGTVTYKGQPVNGALLHLHPVPGPGSEILIPVTQEGTFRSSSIPPGEYKVVVEATSRPPSSGMGGDPTKGLDAAKAAEMKQKLQQMQGEATTPTIAFPNKYKDVARTDLKCTITQGDQTLTLELKD